MSCFHIQAYNLKLVESLGKIADGLELTRGQIALAWLLAQAELIAPIPGTKRVAYLEERAAAAELDLDSDTLQKVSDLFDSANISGDRYTKAGMRSLDRD